MAELKDYQRYTLDVSKTELDILYSMVSAAGTDDPTLVVALGELLDVLSCRGSKLIVEVNEYCAVMLNRPKSEKV